MYDMPKKILILKNLLTGKKKRDTIYKLSPKKTARTLKTEQRHNPENIQREKQKAKREKSGFMLKQDNIKIESLILAQDERWRRA